MTNQENGWKTIREAAQVLGVSELTIRRRIKDGRVAHRLVDGKYYIDLSAPMRPPPERSDVIPALEIEHARPERAEDHDVPEAANASGQGHVAQIDLAGLFAEHGRLAEMAGRADLLEQQLQMLQQQYATLQEGALSLSNRNGWLESKLEERENTIKLLTDGSRKKSWWKRLFSSPSQSAE